MANRELSGDRVGSHDPGVPHGECPPPQREHHLTRERGGLTKKDREFLMERDHDSQKPQATRTRRYQLRKRIKDGIKDFEILSRCLEERDVSQVFNSLNTENREYIKELGIFVYLGFKQTNLDGKRFLKELIEEAEAREGNNISVKVMSEVSDKKSYHIEMESDSPPPSPAGAD